VSEPNVQDNSTDSLVGILKDAGYVVTEGAENVQRMIRVAADDSTERLCSGWGVFPDGTKCGGCKDCMDNVPDAGRSSGTLVVEKKGGEG